MAFHVGQKVECIDDQWNHEGRHPAKGGIYTITGINPPLNPPPHLQCQYFSLAGFSLAQYASDYFRPVVERKTDISVFKAMLNPSHVTVDAMNVADFARELVK